MKRNNRMVALLLSLTLFLGSMPMSVFADVGANEGNKFVFEQELSEVELNYYDMSEKERAIYWEVVNKDIKRYKEEDPNFDEELFMEQLEQVLLAMDSSGALNTSQFRISPKSVELAIPNRVVATAVNVAVSLIVGGATSAAIRAYILKKGAYAATNELVKAVVSRLLALGIREVSGIGTVIRSIVKNVLDPGSTVAEWLDSRDYKPRNGYVDVKAF